jgi:osmotically-inducible protein OsmY
MRKAFEGIEAAVVSPAGDGIAVAFHSGRSDLGEPPVRLARTLGGTMRQRNAGVIALLVLLAAGFGAACSDRTERKAKQAADETGKAVESAAEAAKSAATDAAANLREAGSAAAEATETAAGKVEAAVKEGSAAAGAALETVDVKAALVADTAIDASRIDVDTDAAKKVVVLRGSVPNASQRAAAERLAMEHAKGYRIDNQLSVAN